MELEIRHLRVVAAIADAGSISRAAVSLGYSQPALTAQLQRVERMLGGALFHRDRAGARPSALGEVVLLHARGMLAQHDDLLRDVHLRRTADTEPHTVRIGTAPGPLIGALMSLVRERLPGAEVSLHVEESVDQLFELLAGGRLEFVLGFDYPGYEMPPYPGVTRAVLAVEPVFVLLSADHPLARLDEVPLDALAEEQWLTGEGRDPRMREQFRAACRRAGFTPRRVRRMAASVVFVLVAQGQAVSLAQAQTPARPHIAVRPLAGNPLRVRHLLAWPTHGALAGHGESLREALTAAYWTQAHRSPAYHDWLTRHTP